MRQGQDLITSRDFWNIAGRAGRAFVDHEGKILISLDNTNGAEIDLYTITSKYPELVPDIKKYFVYLYRNSYTFKYNFKKLIESAPLSRIKKEKLIKNFDKKLKLKGKHDWSKDNDKELINDYFDKAKIDNAQSGCLELIKALKSVANSNDVSFEKLIELIADNNISEIHEKSEVIDDTLDWIDDGLLSLHNINSTDNNYDWIDDYFRNSLAYIQAEKAEQITGEEVIQFLKARTKGIITKVGDDREKWKSIITSGIPLNSDLQIEDKLDKLINIIQNYLSNEINIDTKINLLKNIENEIKEINVLSEGFIESEYQDEIRKKWLKAIPLSEIAPLDHKHATDIVTKYYSYSLPWILNGISRKLRNKELNEEADTIEKLSILVELGLPNLVSVKVYQSGIRSRSSANEISRLYDDELRDKSIKFYKDDLISNIKEYKALISKEAFQWLILLSKFSKREISDLQPIPDFKFPDKHKITTRLLAKEINGKQYLTSPDFKVIENVSELDIDFSDVNNVIGVFFDYDKNDEVWKMINLNPYLKFKE